MHLLLTANPLIHAYLEADSFGKAIFLSLFSLSILTWVIFLQKSASLRALSPQKRVMRLDFNKRGGDDPFGHLYSTAIDAARPHLQQSSHLEKRELSLIEAHLQEAVSLEVAQMEKRVSFLSTITSLAPFLGLLGTVWGILLTFSELQRGGAANANATVMGGLAMALGTTVVGLVVAIPSLIAYNALRATIRQRAQQLHDYAHLLLAAIEHERTR